MIGTDIEQRVFNFVANQTCVPKDRITVKTTLVRDLGIDGDDASEFFEDFRTQFHVDLSTLDLTKHFGPEGMVPWAPIIWVRNWLHRGDTPEERYGLIPITVGELVHAARRERWK